MSVPLYFCVYAPRPVTAKGATSESTKTLDEGPKECGYVGSAIQHPSPQTPCRPIKHAGSEPQLIHAGPVAVMNNWLIVFPWDAGAPDGGFAKGPGAQHLCNARIFIHFMIAEPTQPPPMQIRPADSFG